MFKALYLYRNFIFESIKREFFAKYANSVLGSLWSLLNPISMIAVYTLIFSQVMKAKLPGIDSAFAYSIYLCAGVIPWGFFMEISNRSVNMFIENAGILKKVRIPKICLPAIVTGSAFLNFFIVFVLFNIFLIIVGLFPGFLVVYSIPLLLLYLFLALSIGIFLGTLNVFFRDVGQFFGIFTQFWFWLTPIVYPMDILPDKFKMFLGYNPAYPIVRGFQTIYVNHEVPDFRSLVPVVIVVSIFTICALFFFRKHSEEIVDEL